MSRVEENKACLEQLQREAENNPKGTFEQTVLVLMGIGIGVLADISGSLAVIADALTEERKKENE